MVVAMKLVALLLGAAPLALALVARDDSAPMFSLVNDGNICSIQVHNVLGCTNKKNKPAHLIYPDTSISGRPNTHRVSTAGDCAAISALAGGSDKEWATQGSIPGCPGTTSVHTFKDKDTGRPMASASYTSTDGKSTRTCNMQLGNDASEVAGLFQDKGTAWCTVSE